MDKFGGFLIVVVIWFGIGFAIGGANPSIDTKRETVCNYLGGDYHDDICIKDDKVVPINLKGK